MKVGAYWPGVVKPNYQTPRYNEDLIYKVLGAKQERFDQAFQNLQAVRKQALNIRYLNKDGQSQVDQLNSELDDYFNNITDYGDLSNTQEVERHMKVFDKLAGNKQLIDLYRTDKSYQNQMEAIRTMKAAKDPLKAGYSDINYYVWSNQEGGLKDYVNKKASDAVGMSSPEYSPYYHTTVELAKLIPMLKNMGVENLSEDLSVPGIIKQMKVKGISPDRAVNILNSMLSPQAKRQMEIEGEYHFMRSYEVDPDGTVAAFHKNYVSNNSHALKVAQTSVEAMKIDLEKAKLEGRDSSALKESIEQYESEIIPDLQQKASTSIREFQNMSRRELGLHYANDYTTSKINSLGRSISNLSIQQSVKENTAFWRQKSMELSYAKLAEEQAHNRASELLAQQKIAAGLQIAAAKDAAGNPIEGQESIYGNATTLSPAERKYDRSRYQELTNQFDANLKPMSTNEMRSVLFGEHLTDGAGDIREVNSIESVFLKSWKLNNSYILNGKSDAAILELASKDLKLFREGKLEGYDTEYSEYKLTQQAKDAVTKQRYSYWNTIKAKHGIPVNSGPVDGYFWSSNGQKFSAEEISKEVGNLMASDNTFGKISSYNIKLTPEQFSYKNKDRREQAASQAKSVVSAGISESMQEGNLNIEDIDPTSVKVDADGTLTFATKAEFKNGSSGRIITIDGKDHKLSYSTTYTIKAPSMAKHTSDPAQVLFDLGKNVSQDYKGFTMNLVPYGESIVVQLIKDGTKVSESSYTGKDFSTLMGEVRASIDNFVKVQEMKAKK